MSFIPFNAISGALSPVQRAANDLASARLQTRKDSHHTEEVEELDDTGVSSIHDGQEKQGRGKNPDKRERRPDEPEENVEIAALSDTPPKLTHNAALPPSTLDISA